MKAIRRRFAILHRSAQRAPGQAITQSGSSTLSRRFLILSAFLMLLTTLLTPAAFADDGEGTGATQTKPNPHSVVSSDGTVEEFTATRPAGNVPRKLKADAGSGRRAPAAEQAVDLGAQIVTPEVVPLADSATDGTTDAGVVPQSTYADTRFAITNPAAYPNRAVVLLSMRKGSSYYRCSGFMISPNTVATAGHCVFWSGSWADQVTVYPGYTGSYAPYGTCTHRTLYSVYGWTGSGNSEYDYGVVKLNCTIGNSTGWLGFRWQSASLNGLGVRTQGYPVDKGWGQWGHNGTVSESNVRTVLSSYTTGFNGAPMYDSGLYAVAIYSRPISKWVGSCSNGICSGYTASFSRGTRITYEVFNNLQYWRNLP